MSEIERLRDELNRLRRISDEHKDLIGFRPDEVVKAIEFRVDKIARLEAEQADPWREHRASVEFMRKTVYAAADVPKVVAYVDHLTAENDRLAARVAELEAAAIRVDFENGVATLNPDALVLDPARVLATAVGVMGEMGFIGTADLIHRRAKAAKPYRLKGDKDA